MKSFDFLLEKTHAVGYNCEDFSRDVWFHLTGRRLPSVLSKKSSFKLLDKPETPCLSLMLRDKCAPHLGVYVRGRIVHLTERGPEFVDAKTASRGFKEVKYYQCL